MIYNNSLNGGRNLDLFTWYLIAKSNQYISVGTQGIFVCVCVFFFLIFLIIVMYRIVARFGFFPGVRGNNFGQLFFFTHTEGRYF